MMATLMESCARGQNPLACKECEGEQTVGLTSEGCHHGGTNCPCGVESVPCPRCEGSGIEPCDWCADRSAVVVSPSRDLLCAPCDAQRLLELAAETLGAVAA